MIQVSQSFLCLPNMKYNLRFISVLMLISGLIIILSCMFGSLRTINDQHGNNLWTFPCCVGRFLTAIVYVWYPLLPCLNLINLEQALK